MSKTIIVLSLFAGFFIEILAVFIAGGFAVFVAIGFHIERQPTFGGAQPIANNARMTYQEYALDDRQPHDPWFAPIALTLMFIGACLAHWHHRFKQLRSSTT